MTDTPTPPSAADIALIADVTPRRQDQDPEAFVIFQAMQEQRAAQMIEARSRESSSLWSGMGPAYQRGIYVDMSDADLWAEAVATKVRRQEHLKSPEGNAARHLIVVIRLATEIQQAAFLMQDATSRSFRNEAGSIGAVLQGARLSYAQLGNALDQVSASLQQIQEDDEA